MGSEITITFGGHGRPDETAELEEFFRPILDRILHFESKIMQEIDDLNTKLDTQAAAISSLKADNLTLIGVLGDVRTALADLQTQAGSALKDQLNALAARIDAGTADIASVDKADKDAAQTPAAPPPPPPATPA